MPSVMEREIDSLDHEHIDDALRSVGYTLIARRVQNEIARLTNDLVITAHAPEMANEIRGRILGLKLALEIPHNIAQESRAKKPAER